MAPRIVSSFGLALASLLVLAGCGQRGPLVRAQPVAPTRDIGTATAMPAGPRDLTFPRPADMAHRHQDCAVPDPAAVGTAGVQPAAASAMPPCEPGQAPAGTRDGRDAVETPSVLNPYLLPSQPGLDPALR